MPQFNLNIPPDMLAKVKRRAAAEARASASRPSAAAWIRQAIDERLKRERKP